MSTTNTTVVSGGLLAGQVSIALDPASDLGVPGDNLTSLNTPTYDVTVNQAGVIKVDYRGDGVDTSTQTVNAAGVYTFTAPTLLDERLHDRRHLPRRPAASRLLPKPRLPSTRRLRPCSPARATSRARFTPVT